MSVRLETNFVKTKYINPPIASLPLIFSNCLNFRNNFFVVVKQNLKGIYIKKVLNTSELKIILQVLYKYYLKTY